MVPNYTLEVQSYNCSAQSNTYLNVYIVFFFLIHFLKPIVGGAVLIRCEDIIRTSLINSVHYAEQFCDTISSSFIASDKPALSNCAHIRTVSTFTSQYITCRFRQFTLLNFYSLNALAIRQLSTQQLETIGSWRTK